MKIKNFEMEVSNNFVSNKHSLGDTKNTHN